MWLDEAEDSSANRRVRRFSYPVVVTSPVCNMILSGILFTLTKKCHRLLWRIYCSILFRLTVIKKNAANIQINARNSLGNSMKFKTNKNGESEKK